MPLRLSRDYRAKEQKKTKEVEKTEKIRLVNTVCLRCVERCKQSDKVDVLSCPNFEEK